MASYRLLVHDTFAAQYVALKKSDPQVASSLLSKLRVIGTNPRAGGATALSAVADPALAGKIYRVWVRGNNGHRLVYLATESGVPDLTVVCPLLVTAGRKSSWDYDSIAMEDVSPIADAVAAGRWSEFRTFDALAAK